MSALVYAQLAYFLEIEINSVETAIAPRSRGEALGHVSGAIQMNIVQDDGGSIPAQYHVLFDKISPHGMRQRLGCQGVFGKVATGPAVGDYNGPVVFHNRCRV